MRERELQVWQALTAFTTGMCAFACSDSIGDGRPAWTVVFVVACLVLFAAYWQMLDWLNTDT